jgi:hypothetical protein
MRQPGKYADDRQVPSAILSGTDFEPGVAQNWAQFFVAEKLDEANSLQTSGEPGRTRTCNPLTKRPSPTLVSFRFARLVLPT